MQYLPSLKNMGVEVTSYPLLREDYIRRLYSGRPTFWLDVAVDYFRQVIRLFQAGSFDCLWIEKEIFPNLPAWAEQMLQRMHIPYVVDYDDATFHNYDLSASPLKRLLARKIDKVMAGADVVVCGNEYLASRARDAGASRIEVMPTVIDLQRYIVADKPLQNRIVVGWIGAPSTVKYLDLVAPVLAELSIEFPLQLQVVGAFFSWHGLDVVTIPWSEDTEVASIQQFDIGIMPLRDTPWERGKCGYKLIQYMACGLPVVGSAVGVNKALIQPGVNGYLASTGGEWDAALRGLIQNGDLRRKMGAVGRVHVEQKYCLQVTAHKVAELFEFVVGRAR
jgi:glycosyltransferase involved in cell wall biosynthesis